MKDKVTVIGIAGGTGSGKTTVVKKLVEVLPPHYVAVVPLDSYYNDTSQMTEEERHRPPVGIRLEAFAPAAR